MTRIFALIGIILIVGTFVFFHFMPKGGGKALEVKYRYLVVDIIGPPEWERTHSFSIRWRGKDFELPVVFRVAGPAEDFKMGRSRGENFGELKIGNEVVPVTAKADTKFQTRNTPIFAFVVEESSRKAVTISVATSVAISPPGHPGELGPFALEGEFESSAKKLENRLKELIAGDQVIEVAAVN
jgi:hypothetical protein